MRHLQQALSVLLGGSICALASAFVVGQSGRISIKRYIGSITRLGMSILPEEAPTLEEVGPHNLVLFCPINTFGLFGRDLFSPFLCVKYNNAAVN
jgi:hypothetical protein